ncbi:MAG: thiolase family protein [Rickettsiales bacterium]|nr:thiolase family protein [Rickettsiales bacterium]
MSAVICGYARSPFTPAHKGELIETRPDDIGAAVIDGLLEKTGLDPALVEDVVCGCAFPEGEQGFNLGRQLVFLSKLENRTGGSTVNRWCGSSMQAIHMAAGSIATGAGEIFIAIGVESMTRIPIGGFNPMPNPELYESYPEAYMNMGETAEEVATLKDVSREAMEQFALTSHQKAAAADFSKEIIPVNGVTTDGCIRGDSTVEKMATLNPAFRAEGRVTAATSSPLTDGAAAVIVASEEAADRLGLPKLARIKSMAVAGLEPEIMGLGPIPASKLALERAGLTAADIDIWEINEAFAAQAIPVQAELNIPADKLNIDGGAIALGHPLGASGARITGKAAQLLHDTGGNYAVSSMCIGGGMGIATVLEKI